MLTWRRDLGYDLLWDDRWQGWYLPTPLWFWEDMPYPENYWWVWELVY